MIYELIYLTKKMKNIKNVIWLPLAFLPVWFLIYHNLQPMTDWFIDTVLGMTKGAHLTEALRFFVFEFPKVMLLLTLIIFFVGIIRTYFTPERTRKALAPFEARYQISTDEFERKFKSREIEETLDFLDWWMEVEALRHLEAKHNLIKDARVE